MVAWIPTSKDEANALEQGAVGRQSDAISAMQAVQAIAAMPIADASYIVQLSEQATLLTHRNFSHDIPVIDLSAGSLDDTQRDATIAAVAAAATSWGIFQVVNHGMPASTLNGMMAMAKDFFAMPEEEKLASAVDHTKDVPQGYRPISDSFQRNASWSNVMEYVLRPQHLSATNQAFPSATFRATVEDFGKGLNQVLARLVELLLTAFLGTQSGRGKANKLLDGNHMQVFRIASYDPCPQPDAVMGIRSHVDHTLITGLVQDDTGGLQVEKDGQWHGVTPLPGAIVILMGTAIQMISNDNIKAVNHRAVVNSHSSRITLTTAINPSNDTVLFPAPELVDEMHPALYRPFSYRDFRVAAFEEGILKSRDAMEKFRINSKPVEAKSPSRPDGDKPPCPGIKPYAKMVEWDHGQALRDVLRSEGEGIPVA